MMCSRWLLLIVMLICVAGCGGEGSSSSSSASEEEIETEPDIDNTLTNLLSGTDSDNDGVRDDVQLAINERYPTDETKKKALAQATKALQDAILAGDSPEQAGITDASSKLFKSIDCIHVATEDPTFEIGFLEVLVVNTTQRREAYMRFNENLSGRHFDILEAATPCE